MSAHQDSTASGGRALFLREFLRSPLRTASAVPSSVALARHMLQPLTSQSQPTLVELGPGTGAFTVRAPELVPDGLRHVAIESNADLATHLQRRCPWVEVVHGSAADLTSILADRKVSGVDLLVSGLPWQCFADTAGPALLEAIATSLNSTGVYTQFTYQWSSWAPPARRQHRLLQARFGQIKRSPTIWQNLPPAFVYTCSQPTSAPAGAHR